MASILKFNICYIALASLLAEKRIYIFCNSLGDTFAETHLRNQLIRSATGSCLNYGEAQGAESKKDFVHKNGIVLKELKELRSTLKIMTYSEFGDAILRTLLLKESEELCAIFGKIIFNTKKNMIT